MRVCLGECPTEKFLLDGPARADLPQHADELADDPLLHAVATRVPITELAHRTRMPHRRGAVLEIERGGGIRPSARDSTSGETRGLL